MSKCVLCFLPIHSDDVLQYCPNDNCPHERQPDSVASDYLGREVSVGYAVRERRALTTANWQPENKFCRSCGTPLQRSCARCHFPLTDAILNSDVTTVAFAGPRSSGKTVAMKVGLSPLYHLLVEAGGALSLLSTVSTVEVTDDDLRSHILPATERRLPWTLVFSMGVIQGRSRILAIRDIAGEDLAEPNPPGRFDYFASADLVVFLFDPFEVPQVRHALDEILPPAPLVGANPAMVFTNLLGHIGQGTPHVAMVVSKFDVLHELAGVSANVAAPFQNPGAGYMRSRQREFQYDERTGALISEEVRSLLAMLSAQDLVNLAEHPPNMRPMPTRFFAMSALGAATDGTELHAHGKSPFRILDPLFWILAERGILPRLDGASR